METEVDVIRLLNMLCGGVLSVIYGRLFYEVARAKYEAVYRSTKTGVLLLFSILVFIGAVEFLTYLAVLRSTADVCQDPSTAVTRLIVLLILFGMNFALILCGIIFSLINKGRI